MVGEFLVDTNIVVAFLEGEKAVQERFRFVEPLVLCVPVLGELFYGVLKSSHIEANIQRLNDLCNNINLVNCTPDTAKIYGQLKVALFARGRPIPNNDIWIAASVLEHDLTLVTRDAHFSVVPNLKTTRW